MLNLVSIKIYFETLNYLFVDGHSEEWLDGYDGPIVSYKKARCAAVAQKQSDCLVRSGSQFDLRQDRPVPT